MPVTTLLLSRPLGRGAQARPENARARRLVEELEGVSADAQSSEMDDLPVVVEDDELEIEFSDEPEESTGDPLAQMRGFIAAQESAHQVLSESATRAEDALAEAQSVLAATEKGWRRRVRRASPSAMRKSRAVVDERAQRWS